MLLQVETFSDHGRTIIGMSNQTAILSENAGQSSSTEAIPTRFGEMHIDTGKSVHFPRGLLGIPERFRFALTNFPSPKMQQFKLLQSLDEFALSFITLPLETHNAILALQDIRAACNDLQIAESSLVTLLIVSVHRNPGQVQLSANARAPIFIDASQRVGAQYVFQHDKYNIQHMLG